jgi:hypothetical protein
VGEGLGCLSHIRLRIEVGPHLVLDYLDLWQVLTVLSHLLVYKWTVLAQLSLIYRDEDVCWRGGCANLGMSHLLQLSGHLS